MRAPLKLAVLACVAALVVGTAVLATVARTNRVQVTMEFAYAIWNDEQVVVFVVRSVQGSRPTVLEQLRSSVAPLLGTPSAPSTRFAVITTVARYQDGMVRSTTHHANDRDQNNIPFPNPVPRFFNGRALAVGGFWNGNEIERVATADYMRLLRLPEADDDAGRWRAGKLLQLPGSSELPVHVRGEAVRLRASRTGADASIELLRAGAAAVRLLDVQLGPRSVSAREYESIFHE